MDIKINPAFRDLLPKPTPEERETLERNLVADGRAIDPIILWGDTIIDGHSRFEICQKQGLPFTTTQIAFSSADQAAEWIVSHQEGRRNWTPQQLAYTRGKLAELRAEGGRRDPTKSTADEFHVSPRTIRRDAERARAADKLTEEVRAEFLRGGFKASQSELESLAEKRSWEQREIVARVRSGKAPNVREAIAGRGAPRKARKIESLKAAYRQFCQRLDDCGLLDPYQDTLARIWKAINSLRPK